MNLNVKCVKIVTIGTGGVGKTSFIRRCAGEGFSTSYICTIGIDFIRYTYSPTVKTIIWDTAGQERFKSISASYFRGVDAVLLFYDVTNRESFEKLDSWIAMVPVHPKSNEAIPVVLVGNKIDLAGRREVTPEEVRAYCEKRGFYYTETSCKENTGIKDALHKAVLLGLPTATILKGHDKLEKSSCCF